MPQKKKYASEEEKRVLAKLRRQDRRKDRNEARHKKIIIYIECKSVTARWDVVKTDNNLENHTSVACFLLDRSVFCVYIILAIMLYLFVIDYQTYKFE